MTDIVEEEELSRTGGAGSLRIDEIRERNDHCDYNETRVDLDDRLASSAFTLRH